MKRWKTVGKTGNGVAEKDLEKIVAVKLDEFRVLETNSWQSTESTTKSKRRGKNKNTKQKRN